MMIKVCEMKAQGLGATENAEVLGIGWADWSTKSR
jgi:hypothetical protein